MIWMPLATTLLAAAAMLPSAAGAADSPATVRDETYQLNIVDRRIDLGPYRPSLEVGLDRPLQLRVGVELSAERVTIHLHGITGTVRFHGDLTSLTRLAASHRTRATSAQEKP